jgi:hypothetical protein
MGEFLLGLAIVGSVVYFALATYAPAVLQNIVSFIFAFIF